MTMNEETRQFVRQHRTDDVRQLALRGAKTAGVDLPLALQQIAGWQAARQKLPAWAAQEGIAYPPHLSMEQCSSELTARYKAAMVERLAGGRRMFVDLTGGFGVDFYYMSQPFAHRVYVEQSAALCALARHNFQVLGHECDVVCGKAAAYGTTAVPSSAGPSSGAPAAAAMAAGPSSEGSVVGGFAADVVRPVPSAPVASLPAAGLSSGASAAAATAAGPFSEGSVVGGFAADVVFLDPARRNEHGARTYGMADCTPDVVALWPLLQRQARHVVLKLSPMLDWHQAVSELQQAGARVVQVHIVSVANECKELLLVADNKVADAAGDQEEGIAVHCANLSAGNEQRFSFLQQAATAGAAASSGRHSAPPLSAECPPPYLYEPNASVMKAGCFALLEERFGMQQIAPNSHLFLSSQQADAFPGRCFRIEAATTMNKKALRQALAGIASANVAVRNFPLTAQQLRQRLRLNDGGATYLFATTTAAGRHVLYICRKIG